ncbi:MAG: hypothetical protein ACRCUJ_12945 [Phocaeicola sp.]
MLYLVSVREKILDIIHLTSTPYNIPTRNYLMKITNEKMNEWIAEWEEDQQRELLELTAELAALKVEFEKRGLVFITYQKFISLTQYLSRLLEEDGRVVWSVYSARYNRKGAPKGSMADDIRIAQCVLSVKEKHPDCIHYLERIWLGDVMKYAPSTIAAKLSRIRKHQREGHLPKTYK